MFILPEVAPKVGRTVDAERAMEVVTVLAILGTAAALRAWLG